MPRKLEKGFKKGYKPEEPEELKEEKEEEEAEEEKIESPEEESPKGKKEKPEERIILKPAVTYAKPKKGSWVVFEAPDKNGKKIVKYFGKAARMKEKLLGQEEIITFIPREQGEHKSIPQIVNLNGYKLNIPKNTYISLPIQVAEVIRNSHQQVEEAYEEMNRLFGLGRDTKSIEALQ